MQTDLQTLFRTRNTVEPEKGPAHRDLAAFAGRWWLEGVSVPGTAGGTPEPVTGEEIYEWLEGRYFLLNRFDHHTATDRHTGLGWIGYDKPSATYLSYSVSNLGYLRIYQVDVGPGEIHFQGERERGRLLLSADQKILRIFWERSADGISWTLLRDLQARRQTSPQWS